MDLLLLIARLLLAGVFSVAAIAKLFDRDGSRQALIGFGLPKRLAPSLAVALPVAEMTVALALLPLATAFWGAVGALALLGLFIFGIALSMARGEAPDCHCFGQIHSEPAGWSTLIRNGVLVLVASFVIVAGGSRPGSSLTGWVGDLSTTGQAGLVAIVVIAAILAAQTWFLFQLMAQNGRLLERIERLETGVTAVSGPARDAVDLNVPVRGLPVGSPAPGFSLPGLYGETMTLDSLRAAGKPLLLLFTDPNCGPCNAMLPDVARWQREYADRMTVVPITRGDASVNLGKVGGHGITTVLLQEDREISDAYHAHGTPTGIVVRTDGAIGSSVAAGAVQIEQLVRTTLQKPVETLNPAGRKDPVRSSSTAGQSAAPLTPMPVGGQPAPRLRLPGPNGEMVDPSDTRGRPAVLLFWNPNCGFCQKMLADLVAWEANRPDGAPDLLVLSNGGVDAGPASALDVPFLLDEGFEAGRAFGASGTPSAVLIGGDGKIASNVVVGADRVMGLLDPSRRLSPSNGNGTQQPLAPLVRMGSPAPDFELPDLDGNTISSSSLVGEETLVLFWDPSCGFCRQMLDELRHLDGEIEPRQILVVSTGAVEVNKEMELRSTVVLDQGFDLGRRFGASGTPSAILVDRRGRIASPVAAGAPAIRDLASSKSSHLAP